MNIILQLLFFFKKKEEYPSNVRWSCNRTYQIDNKLEILFVFSFLFIYKKNLYVLVLIKEKEMNNMRGVGDSELGGSGGGG